jgi:hypothetical protein
VYVTVFDAVSPDSVTRTRIRTRFARAVLGTRRLTFARPPLYEPRVGTGFPATFAVAPTVTLAGDVSPYARCTRVRETLGVRREPVDPGAPIAAADAAERQQPA